MASDDGGLAETMRRHSASCRAGERRRTAEAMVADMDYQHNGAVMETDRWLREHLGHAVAERPMTVVDIGAPWDDKGVRVSCPCGAKHTTFMSKLPKDMWI